MATFYRFVSAWSIKENFVALEGYLYPSNPEWRSQNAEATLKEMQIVLYTNIHRKPTEFSRRGASALVLSRYFELYSSRLDF